MTKAPNARTRTTKQTSGKATQPPAATAAQHPAGMAAQHSAGMAAQHGEAHPPRGGHPHAAKGHPPKRGSGLTVRYGITEQNLRQRREFMRLGDEERALLLSMREWAYAHAATMAREFYDWQFAFAPTRVFFEAYAQQKGIPMDRLRSALEATQEQYLLTLFDGAESSWGVEYFDYRMEIGRIHDVINLPFKWYIGAYTEFVHLFEKHLSEEYEAPEVLRILLALQKVMNYDMQAVGDSFLLNTLESMGLDVEGVVTRNGSDKTEHVDQVKASLARLLEQASAISEGRLEDPVLQTAEQGRLGKDFARMTAVLRQLIDEVNRLIQHAQRGELQARANAGQFTHGYQALCEGVNEMLSAVADPITRAVDLLGRMSAGDFRQDQQAAQGDGRQGAQGDGQQGAFRELSEAAQSILRTMRDTLMQLRQMVSTVAAAAEELTAVSQQMQGNAESTSLAVQVVSAATDEVSGNLSMVSSSSEEMQASIREIATSSAEAARVAGHAVTMADATNTTVAKLGDSSQRIGDVIKVITSIAQQTNLLALNATIEAARAGEAGKGFAVVANEVKELAKQTAKATQDIGKNIEAIQQDSVGAVKAIAEISGVISQINDISQTIASAVEEQTATTSEISRNLTDAARGSTEITQNVVGVSESARSTAAGARDTQQASRELSELAAELNQLVGRFQT